MDNLRSKLANGVAATLRGDLSVIDSPAVGAKQKQFPDWLKSSLAVIGPIGAGMWFFLTAYVPAKIDSQTKNMSTDIATLRADIENMKPKVQEIEKLSADVAGIKGTLELLGPFIREKVRQKFNENTKLTSNELKQHLPELKTTISVARQAGVRMPPSTVVDLGKKLLEGYPSGVDIPGPTWQVLTDLADYRSFLNGELPNVPRGLSPPPGHYEWEYDLVPAENAKRDVIVSVDTDHMVPRDQAAVMEKLGSNLNSKARFGPRYMMLTYAPILLDNMRIKNVIFKNCKIVYRGGPIQMEHVYFVDCSFVISPKSEGRIFVTDILRSLPVDFAVSPS